MRDPANARIGIIGLGYVGLPLAVAFGHAHDTVGFDIDPERIAELQLRRDRTQEVLPEEWAKATRLTLTTDTSALAACDVYIVTVPTPVDERHDPDLQPLISASETIGALLNRGDVVVYESTVYPGTTEEICVPVLERVSGLRFGHDFTCGYSPERVSPGDNARRLPDIVKITSGSDSATADFVDALYRSIVHAGTWKASSIRVAEAAKVVENIQRDVNIALMNELAMVFDRLGVDTLDVLEAAGSKWNFLPFRPGLVGGHCIGVDPYYLLHRSEAAGFHPELIHVAREVNERIGPHVAQKVIEQLRARGKSPRGSRVLVLGVTFKEDCPDLRNSKVMDVIAALREAGMEIAVMDPWMDEEAASSLGIALIRNEEAQGFDAVVLAVAHRAFREMDEAAIRALGTSDAVFYDVKSVWPRPVVTERL